VAPGYAGIVEKSDFALRPVRLADRQVLDQESFHKIVSRERKRTERSRRPFLLMLLDAGAELGTRDSVRTLTKIVSTLVPAVRETDAVGWYESGSVVGVIFTELDCEDRNAIVSTMLVRVSSTLRDHLTGEEFDCMRMSFHVFPEEWTAGPSQRPSNPSLYPDLANRDSTKKLARTVKRAIDIVVSILAVTLGSPLCVLIAVAIKLTSAGPVFYRQTRAGQYGTRFCLLKFRSMYDGNDDCAHKKYVQQLIAGVADKHVCSEDGKAVYKLTQDPRVTSIGVFLRRSSLDELPQFFNVLKGEMSLVGPRPPVDYEVEKYEVWHRRRLMEAKPGITGLWQVNGRNRLKFDEMVRLDLKYARTWSPWLDLKILLRTPKAMLDGAH
jgi:lipopolysaccharide/colanic/teichoic acid biosynthesis glycosyltransferase